MDHDHEKKTRRVMGKKIPGIQTAGLPVNAARIPFRPLCTVSPTGTTSRFWCGYTIASRRSLSKHAWTDAFSSLICCRRVLYAAHWVLNLSAWSVSWKAAVTAVLWYAPEAAMEASDVWGVWDMKGDWRKESSSCLNSKDWVSASERRRAASQGVVCWVGRGMTWMGRGVSGFWVWFLDGEEDWILCRAVCMMLLMAWVSGSVGDGK